MISGCFGSLAAPADTTVEVPADTAPAVSETVAVTTSASAAALASEDEPDNNNAKKEEKPLVVALEGNAEQYTPFIAESELDKFINKLSGVTLLGRTRTGRTVMNGATGETEEYNGRRYEYGGIADTVVTADEEAGTYTYTFNLRSDIKFADGETLDADDVIFSLYAVLDNSAGTNALTNAGITGALNYRFNSPIAEDITDELLKETLASDEVAVILRDRLYIPVLEEQYENVLSLYGDGSVNIYTSSYPDPDDLFVFFYCVESGYEKPEDGDKSTLIEDIAKGYGNNYRQFAGRTVGDERMFDETAEYLAIEYLTKQQSGEETPEEVTNISGIKKTGRFGVSVTVRGNGRALEEALRDLIIAPLHYYGDESMYDYNAGRFGFERGHASDLTDGHRGEPVGAGAYTFSENAADGLILTANEYYYGGKAATRTIKLITAGDAAMLIADGSADITTAMSAADLTEQIETANRSLEKVNVFTLGGYGFGVLALNPQSVNIAGEPFSDASCALRKAIATAVEYYKEASVKEYFGEYASVCDYPVIDGIIPDTQADYYSAPFVTDSSGKPIFDEDMTARERKEALKKACLGYLAKAGYKVSEEGVITEAPEGGRLVFSAEYGTMSEAGGHPAAAALNAASGLLAELGITLNVVELSDPGLLYSDLASEAFELAAFYDTDTLVSSFLHGFYNINTDEINELISAAADAETEDAPAAYYAVYDKAINEYAALVPMYERSLNVLYSALRIDGSSFTPDMTTAYNWQDETDRIVMK